MSTNRVIGELAKAADLNEEQASKVLSILGLDVEKSELIGLNEQAFKELTVNDLRISAKVGRMLVAS